MESEYKCVRAFAQTEIIIEKSRFIGYAKNAESEEEAREFLTKIRSSHPFATHNCYAYIAENGVIARFSDDGEPQGTAGMPILEVIKNKKLVNTAVVVTRYFGGIKLGAGGLVRAYSQTAAAAIDAAGEKTYRFSERFSVSFPYEYYSPFLKFKEKFICKAEKTDFSEDVNVILAVPASCDFYEKLNDFFQGKAAISRLNEDFVCYEDRDGN